MYLVPTEAIVLCFLAPKDWSQLLRVSRKHKLTAPMVIRVQEVRHRNDTLRFCCMTRFVYENVREMMSRE